ncbi:MAG: cryptochrome/photolyase family protein [Candidatus Kapabacteria bacterium]|nr:cryptochrome/photolyase family protein [Ignavibacteriota bacterium]MCW5883643.1 cryptochrome/photolyase family protein [Candidatus Kapabacteria bacterium]
MEVSLIFPNHIYEYNPCIKTNRKVFIVEESLYFTSRKFHKQKLVLHRASMKFYEEYLTKYGYDVDYIAFWRSNSLEDIFKMLSERGVKKIHHVETVDYHMEIEINSLCRKYGMTRKLYNTPNFMIKHDEAASYFDDGKYLMADFYIKQRKKLDILIKDGKPIGGKWSFDTENRKKMPDNVKLPEINFPEKNKHVYEAIDYINKHFPDNPGRAEEFKYPVTFQSAIQFLDEFLKTRMENYGAFQDAILSEEVFLFHSVLTPFMNTGILSPQYIVNRALEFHDDYDYPLNSLEGFIRQIIGWREFIRAVYVIEGNRQRNSNFWKAERSIPKSFWTGETGIKPIDDSIKKNLKHGWCHHIERLMVLGNFMQLCEFNPDEVYNWFMEMFVDAYEWVMVPNVYGMSQYADGGLMSTKPYLSGSNYILKMSDYKKDEWCDIWDALYRRFIFKNRDVLAQNPRMKLIIHQIDNMEKDKLESSLKLAEEFLSNLK